MQVTADLDDKLTYYEAENIMGIKVPNCAQDTFEEKEDAYVEVPEVDGTKRVCLAKTLMFQRDSPSSSAGVSDLPHNQSV